MAPKPFPSQAAATSDASVPRVLGCSPRLPARCHRCHHGPCCHLPGTQRPARGAERLGSPGSPRPQKLVWQKGFATSCGEGQDPPAAPACSFDVPALMPRSSITKCGLKMCPSRRVAERTAAPQSCPRPLRREGGTAGWHRLGTWWPRVAARAPGTACWGLRAAFACCQLHVCPGAAEGSPRLPPAPEQHTALPKEHPPRCVPRGLLHPPVTRSGVSWVWPRLQPQCPERVPKSRLWHPKAPIAVEGLGGRGDAPTQRCCGLRAGRDKAQSARSCSGTPHLSSVLTP